MKTKFLVFAAIGAAITLALTSGKGEAWRNDLMKDARKWRKKLGKMAGETGDEITALKSLIGKEISGLGKDARERILAILDESRSTAKNVKHKLSNGMNG